MLLLHVDTIYLSLAYSRELLSTSMRPTFTLEEEDRRSVAEAEIGVLCRL